MFDDYTVTTDKDFELAVAAVIAKAEERGFQILHLHDVNAILAENGFKHEPLKIIEMCRPKFGSLLLMTEEKMSLMMPCKIVVYKKAGQTFISALRPRMIGQFFPDLAASVDEEDVLMRSIIDASK